MQAYNSHLSAITGCIYCNGDFCLPVFTSLNYLYGPCPIKISSSIAIYPLLQGVVILITISTSESFYHVQQTKSSELALFCELDENYEDIYFLQTHTYLSMKLFILENKQLYSIQLPLYSNSIQQAHSETMIYLNSESDRYINRCSVYSNLPLQNIIAFDKW